MYVNCDIKLNCNLNLKCTYMGTFLQWNKTITILMLSCEGFPSGATVGYAKSQVRDILKGEFNKSVELQVHLFRYFILR